MARLARRVALQAHIEATYAAGLTGEQTWQNALQILPRGRPRQEIKRMNESREFYTPYLGGSDDVPGPRVAEIGFEVEMAPSGTAGVAPLWGKLLRACQFAETVTADTRVEYTPVSEPGESLVMRYWEDGGAHYSRGCRGQVSILVEAYKIPRLQFLFRGFDTAHHTSTAMQPANPYTGWQHPTLPMSSTSTNIKLGCSYANGSLSGGDAYPSKGFTLDMGHTLTYDAIIGSEKVVVTERDPKGRMTLELTPDDEGTWRTAMNTSTEASMGWEMTRGDGRSVVFFFRRMKRLAMQAVDENLFRRNQVEFGAILHPADPNDDFMRICLK